MKQKYALSVLFALILASRLTSFGCYSSTSRRVNEDMSRALTLTMQEQQSDVITQDTIRTFNSHLQIAALRGKATIVVDGSPVNFKPYARCSEATIFSLSDQRPTAVLWAVTIIPTLPVKSCIPVRQIDRSATVKKTDPITLFSQARNTAPPIPM